MHRDHLIATLTQGLEFLANISDDVYRRSPATIEMSPVGEHYRHHLDYVQVLVRGLSDGWIDYDQRERNLEVSTQRATAIEKTHQLIAELREIPDPLLHQQVEAIHASYPEGPRVATQSTPAREFLFVNSHASHHFAIIRLIAELLGNEVDPTFGIAPSTLKHQETTGLKQK